MKTMMRKLVNRGQRLPRAATVLLIGWMFAVIAASTIAADSVSTEAGPEGPAQTAYAPANRPGPVISVISGQTSPASYQTYAAGLARLGYSSVLLTGEK